MTSLFLERSIPDHVANGRADDLLAVEQRLLCVHPGRCDRAAGHRGAHNRDRETGVILDPVVVDDPAGQALQVQIGGVLDRARGPEVLREPPVAPGAQQVVQEDAAPVERLVEQRDAVDREEERLQRHEVRREPEQARALLQRFVDQPEAELLEVSKATVDKARGPPRRPRGERDPPRDVEVGRSHATRKR